MDKDSFKILEFIRDNPLSNSDGMDGFILKDLNDMGYIKAIDVTTDDSNGIPEFIEMRATLYGKNALAGYEDSKKKTKVEAKAAPEWHNKALGKIAIGVITGVILIFCGVLLTKHFGIA
ncbi:MAG TPA: hypothetical protein DIC30_07780 [Oceanospirillales bacterium]|jgi:hypothetical protein|nr:hypothetical protein [Oleispira sp.]HCM05894.1 hypothetical protein [Oceanospirillales bacterium]|tara:strand:- start:253 stop:609 length:357 start_codon:yes stop_codon:yes gene_type:complete